MSMRLVAAAAVLSLIFGLAVIPAAESVSQAPTGSLLKGQTSGPLRPMTAMDLINIRDITALQISPDGKSAAYIVTQAVLETNTYRNELFIVATEAGSTPRSLGSKGLQDGNDLNTTLRWSPDGRYITYLMGNRGTKQVWRWPREGGKPEQLTHANPGVEDYVWQADGKTILFATLVPPSPTVGQGIVYVIDNVGAPSEPRPKTVSVYDVSARAERTATRDEVASYKEVNPDRGLYQAGDSSLLLVAKPSPDGKVVASILRVTDPKKYPYYGNGLYLRAAEGGEPIELVAPSANTEALRNFWWSKDGSEIFYSAYTEDGGSGFYAVSVRGGGTRELLRSKDVVAEFSIDAQQSRVACLRENAVTPPEIAVFNLSEGTLRSLVNVNPEFQGMNLSPGTRLEWINKYGDKAFGYLVKPIGFDPNRRYPLIVTTYRARGFLRGGVGDEYPIQLFAASGFAVLVFDAPLERVTKPGDFETAMLRWYSPMASLESAVKMLEGMGIIDVRRMGLTGLSYGAEITLFTITHSDLFQAAVVSGDSARDPMFWYLSYKFWWKQFAHWGLGMPEGDSRARWRELSPALNAARVKAPILINAAQGESNFGFQFYSTMKELGKPIELVTYPGEGHIKTQPKNRYEIYHRNVDWFKYWLQDVEDTNPAKSGQYSRWRVLNEKRASLR